MEEERRKALLGILQGAGLFAASGFIWSAYVNSAKAESLLLRPPGAAEESQFLKDCIRCGLCVEKCPYWTLKLAAPGDSVPVGTPYFKPREVPCYMCQDIPCAAACPTEALDIKRVSTDGKPDINKARMGVAVVDTKHCVAYSGIQCDACYRACPLIDKALVLELKRNERTGKHSFLLPVVDSDECTGCGLCERACITELPTIIVLPREVALGKMGSHYIRGWDVSDEVRMDELNAPESKKDAAKESKKSKKAPGVDALNSVELGGE